MGIKERPDLSPGPTPTQAFQQGALIEGPSNIAGLADMVLNRVDPRRRVASQMGEPSGTPLADRTREAMTGLVERSLGRPVAEPKTAGGRILQSAGAGVTEALPFALAGGGGGLGRIAGRAAMEIPSGALAEVARREAEEVGMGPMGQMGVSALAGLAPMTVGRGIATRIAPHVSSTIRNRTARRIAAEALGAPIDDRQLAIELLEKEIAKPLFGEASVSQVLVSRFPRVEGIARRVSRSGLAGDDLGNAVTKMRLEQAQAARDYAKNFFPGGDPSRAADRYREALNSVQKKVKRAYAKVGNLDGIPTDKVKAAAAKVRVDADNFTDDLPMAEINAIENYGGTVNLKRLERLRQKLGETARKADKDLDFQKARYARELISVVDETQDAVAAAGGSRRIAALRRARNIRRIEEARFGETRRINTGKSIRTVNNPLNRMLAPGGPEDMDNAFSSFLKSDPHPVEVLERTKQTLGGNSEAWGGIRELMNRQIFGEDLSALFTETADGVERLRRGVSRPLRKLRKHSKAFDVVWGEGAAKNAEAFIRRAGQLGQGVVGRVDEFYVTGSNVAESQVKMQQAQIVADMARGGRSGWINAALKAWHLATGRLPDTLEDAEILLAQSLVDPQLAKGFLETLDSQSIAMWQRRAQMAVVNPIRAAAGSTPEQRGGQ